MSMAKVCSYFLEGKCNRGSKCPYLHESKQPPAERKKRSKVESESESESEEKRSPARKVVTKRPKLESESDDADGGGGGGGPLRKATPEKQPVKNASATKV